MKFVGLIMTLVGLLAVLFLFNIKSLVEFVMPQSSPLNFLVFLGFYGSNIILIPLGIGIMNRNKYARYITIIHSTVLPLIFLFAFNSPYYQEPQHDRYIFLIKLALCIPYWALLYYLLLPSQKEQFR